jgi:hypothetical protein
LRKLFTFPTFVAAVFGVGFGASVFLNVQQHSRSEQDAKLLKGTITDLRYQVDQDKKQLAGATSPTPSPSPSETPVATPEPSPSPTPAGQVAGAQSATLIQACNLHSGPSKTSSVLVSFTTFKNLPLPVTLVGARAGTYQNITVNGKTGYVQASCLKF